VSKIVTTMTTGTVTRKDKLQLTSTKEAVSSILPRSSIVEISDMSPADEPSNAMSLITSPELLTSGVVDLHHHVNGDSLSGHELTVAETVPSISSPQVSSISMINDMLDPVTLEQVLHPSSTTMSTPSGAPILQQHTRRDIVPPRLKRSYVEVDDIVVTSSAKRAIVPTAFITSYSPLHHAPQLGSKQMWGEATSMIIDQHNNNG
jgi:hypothetical protein